MALLAATAVAQQPDLAVAVSVDLSKPGIEIDRNLYGQFAEDVGQGIYGGIWVGEDSPIPNIHGYRTDVVEALKKLHVPVLRWPGGCFADRYDWRDGVGPRNERPVRLNMYGSVPDNNAFGTHEFLAFAELIGAQPYIAGNVGSLSPRDMADWLQYMTATAGSRAEERRKNGRDQPWTVPYFGIGNELWGCGGFMRTEYAADVSRRYAALLEAWPPAHKLIKVASGPSGNLRDFASFTEAMMKNIRNPFSPDGYPMLFQALSLHYYTFPIGKDQEIAFIDDGKAPLPTRAIGFAEDKWVNLLRSARALEHVIRTVSAIMDTYDPKKEVALFVDEWGAWHKAEPGTDPVLAHQQSSLLDAEVASLTLNVFHRHTERVKMANNSEMVNTLQAIMLTDGPKMMVTPTYHVFDMYQVFQGAIPYPVIVSGPKYQFGRRSLPAVDVSVAKGKDGKLYVAAVNLDPNRAVDMTTNLAGHVVGQVLTGPSIDSHNTFEAPEAVRPQPFSGIRDHDGRVSLKLPPKSIVVVSIE